MTQPTKLERIAQDIADNLNTIARAIAKPSDETQALGFGPKPGGQQYVFCNRSKGGLWYSLDADSKPVVIEHEAITGYILKLEFVEVERRKADTLKLRIHLRADKLYVLESGSTSNFAKGVLSAIAKMSPNDLMEPITFVPVPSTESEEVLFCNLYLGSHQVMGEYNSQTDWEAVNHRAIAVVNEANGHSQQQEEPQGVNPKEFFKEVVKQMRVPQNAIGPWVTEHYPLGITKENIDEAIGRLKQDFPKAVAPGLE
jgi:hypothetical protein